VRDQEKETAITYSRRWRQLGKSYGMQILDVGNSSINALGRFDPAKNIFMAVQGRSLDPVLGLPEV
jgi:hypothetical protein